MIDLYTVSVKSNHDTVALFAYLSLLLIRIEEINKQQAMDLISQINYLDFSPLLFLYLVVCQPNIFVFPRSNLKDKEKQMKAL